MDADATARHDDDVDTGQRRAGLRPFVKGDERTRQIARQGVLARQARAAARKRDVTTVAATLTAVADAVDRGTLGQHAAAVAGYVMGLVATGAVPIRHADDAASLLRVLVDVARLEEGAPTSTSVVAHVSTADVMELRRQARAALGMVVDTDAGHGSADVIRG